MAGNRDMRTPLNRVLGKGSAKLGTGEFSIQRLTAVANIPLAIFLIAGLLCLVNSDYETARAWLRNPLVGIGLLLLILSAVYHMYIGMKIILEDYVHGPFLRALTTIGNNFFCWGIGLACIYAVLRLGFGS